MVPPPGWFAWTWAGLAPSSLGVDTFWGLVVGFKRLMDEADRATTFNGLREAGARYGKAMGRNAARAFAMLAMGNTAPGLAAKVPKLPGSMRAAAQAEETQLGIRLVAVGDVETVAMSAETVTITLAPGAMAMTGQGTGGGNPKKDIAIPEGRAKHSFRAAPGHLRDTPANRQWLQEVAADESARLGTDRFGNEWFARTHADGTQVWVQVRHGEIKEAYAAMYAYLKMLYELTGSDDLGGFLGSMSLLEDGTPADPGVWDEWMRAVQHARHGQVDLTLGRLDK